MSWMQKQRRMIIQQMMLWIDEIRKDKGFDENTFPEIDEKTVKRLAMLKYGCTPERADQYLDLIFARK